MALRQRRDLGRLIGLTGVPLVTAIGDQIGLPFQTGDDILGVEGASEAPTAEHDHAGPAARDL